jgi:hypothetical protein
LLKIDLNPTDAVGHFGKTCSFVSLVFPEKEVCFYFASLKIYQEYL